MEIKEIEQKWAQFKDQREFQQRIDPSHPLNFFVGINNEGCEELILVTENEPENIRSTSLLKVEKNIRKDGYWATRIALQDNTYLDIFAKLCLDMIEISRNALSEKEGMEYVVQRYLSWIKVFANIKTILPISVLKGLMGELSFIDYLNKKNITNTEIIDSWQGPLGADRDFVFLKHWFEIKSITTGKNTISISSLNQLETEKQGYIVKYNIDQTTRSDPSSTSVSSMISKIRTLLKDQTGAKEEFERKLIEIGYIDKNEYENIYFSISMPEFFYVDNNFPRLVSKNVPKEVVAATYELSLVGIAGWQKTEEEIWN